MEPEPTQTQVLPTQTPTPQNSLQPTKRKRSPEFIEQARKNLEKARAAKRQKLQDTNTNNLITSFSKSQTDRQIISKLNTIQNTLSSHGRLLSRDTIQEPPFQRAPRSELLRNSETRIVSKEEKQPSTFYRMVGPIFGVGLMAASVVASYFFNEKSGGNEENGGGNQQRQRGMFGGTFPAFPII